jgi:hypothetical protein
VLNAEETLMKMLASFALVAWATCLPASLTAKERGWNIDGSAGYIEGPGLSNRAEWNRRIDAFEDGRRARLGLRWESGESWYLLGAFTRSRFRYESPLNPVCPATPDKFLPPVQYCQTVFVPREGHIEDRHDQLHLGAGFRFELLSSMNGFAEVGHGLSRWNSPDDFEATATSECTSFRFGLGALPHPNCVAVNRYARAEGLTAAVGVELWPQRRFSVSGTVHHQGFRYRIYRNDLYPRFGQANNASVYSINALIADEPKGSWRWASLQARYALTQRWSLLLNLEGGGNRDWEAVDLGVGLTL